MSKLQSTSLNTPSKAKPIELVTDTFGVLANEKGEQIPIKRFTWRNTNRIQVQVITYGATITSIKYPNKKGIVDDVVLGFDDVKGYMDNNYYSFGSTIGRFANFIKNSHFSLNKQDFGVTANIGKHHYNGGKRGFDQVIWNNYVMGNKVILSHLSPDKNEGYPGDLLIFATFELTSQNEFKIEYKATSTKPTVINIANHLYFNLGGHSSGINEVYHHTVMINADCHTITGNDNLPTGEIQSVINTIYDFQRPVDIGSVLEKLDGLDNNFCVNKGVDQGINFVARLYHPSSGRLVELYSNQNGVQLDTANTLPLKDDVKPSVETTVSPYLKQGVSTFDMLDEIHNTVYDLMKEDKLNDYSELLEIIKDLQRKEKTLYRPASRANANTTIKRASLTLEDLLTTNLTSLQKKYLERIVKAIKKIEEPNYLPLIRETLETALENNRQTSQEKVLGSKAETKKSDSNASGIVRGKKGAKYFKHSGICMQSQNYPDAINNSNFPNCVLKPGVTYVHNIVYKFWIKTDQSGISGVF